MIVLNCQPSSNGFTATRLDAVVDPTVQICGDQETGVSIADPACTSNACPVPDT